MPIDVKPLAIPEVRLITPRVFRDPRGQFAETYSRAIWTAAGLAAEFVQENQSFSSAPGVVRGLHFQVEPKAQGKLVRVARGAILDVAVDIRRGSATFARHVSTVLSAENWSQLWIPIGFAHGFCTLEPDTAVVYKVTAPYAPECERGLAFDDPDLGVAWPVSGPQAILSDKDRRQPRLRDLPACFVYQPS